MGETMETNKTEATMENKSASVFFRVLKGFWRFIRFVFRLVFGPLGLAVLILLLLGDFWLESHGLSGSTCDKWFGIGDGPLLKCKRVKAGIFNGVVLQGVSFDMNTKVAATITSLMESGRIMEVNTLNLLAPTSRAPSIMESGIAPRPAVIISAANGILLWRRIVYAA